MVDFSVYGQPMARTAPLNESMLSLPSDADLAVMGMTAQQFADLQNSIGNISLSNTPILSGPLDLIGGSSPYSRTINEFDYMVGAPLSNKGNPTSTLRQSSNDFFVYEGQKVRLVDNKTGQVIFEGAGPADAKKASDMAAQLTSEGGRKANWDIQVGPQTLDTSMMGVPTRPEGSWMTVANENPNSPLGKFGEVLGTALPLALIPLTMGASAPLAGLGAAGNIALGAGVGAASAGLKGGNMLTGGLTGGLTAAGGELLGPVIQSAKGVATPLGKAVGAGIGSTAGNLISGQDLGSALLGGGITAGTTYLGSKLFAPKADPLMEWAKEQGIFDPASLGGSPIADGYGGGVLPSMQAPVSAPTTSGGGLTVTGTPIAPTTPFTPAMNNLFNPARYSGGENVRDTKATEELPEIVSTAILPGTGAAINIPGIASTTGPNLEVTGTRPKLTEDQATTIGSPLTVTGTRPTLPQEQATTTAPPLTVTGTRPTAPQDQATTNVALPVSGGLSTVPETIVTAKKDTTTPVPTGNISFVPSLVDDMVQQELAGKKTPPPDEKTTISDIADYLRLAGLGTGLLGGLFGGGGSGTSPVMYPGGGTGGLHPSFSAKLPTPSMPGASGSFAARPPSQIGMAKGQQRDWNTYGFGPEASFFDYVPERGYSHGGGAHGDGPDRSFAVRGPGDGRSDDIPAMLSDGEYVMDAETVSLLGNGSFEGGAKKLDEFRVNIRKHKGRNLAKGKFSANAKRPERYLAGGRI